MVDLYDQDPHRSGDGTLEDADPFVASMPRTLNRPVKPGVQIGVEIGLSNAD